MPASWIVPTHTKRGAASTKRAFTHRLHWAIWLMAQRLFDTSVYDPARRCVAPCEKKPEDTPPGWHCPAADDPTHAACAESLVFPYRHDHHDGSHHTRPVEHRQEAATAIVRGFACARPRLTEEQGDDFPSAGIHLTASAVRQTLARFPDTH